MLGAVTESTHLGWKAAPDRSRTQRRPSNPHGTTLAPLSSVPHPAHPPYSVMTRQILTRTTTTIVLAVLLTLAFTAASVAPAAATHNGDESGGVSDMLTPSDDSWVAKLLGGLGGGVDRALYAISGPDDTAEENRDKAIQEFNQYNESFISYANNRSLHEGEVVQIDCVVEGETATAYIVAEYNDSTEEYTSAEAVTSTSRSVDHTVTLRKNACDNAAEEIEYFYDNFASSDRDVTQSYHGRMAGKYAGNVDQPFLGGN